MVLFFHLLYWTNVSHLSGLLINYYLNKWWSSTKAICVNSHAAFLTKTKTKKFNRFLIFFYLWCPFFITFQPLDTDSTHWHNYPDLSAIFKLSSVSFPYFNGLNICWGWFRRLSYKLCVTNNASLLHRHKSTSPWSHLNKSKSRFNFSTPCSLHLASSLCPLHEPESVPAWRLPWICPCVCPCVWLWVSVGISSNSFTSVFNEQHRKHPMGEEMRDSLKKHLTKFHKRLNHLLHLNPTDLDNKQNYRHRCLSHNIQILCSALSLEVAFNVYGGYSFHNIAFNLYFCCSQQMIHIQYSE